MFRLSLIFFLLHSYFNLHAQLFYPEDYCLVWSDEFDVDGLPNPAFWRYEQGYVRNEELQYYTSGRLENARVENGHLILEARKDNWEGHEYTSASLVTWGKVVHRYGRFEIRAKIDARPGSWPAFWTLGERGEWPSNGEIDIMEYYNNKIHANVAWGIETRWSAKWNSQNRDVSSLGAGWANEFHTWRMEWNPEFIRLYVDDILMNSTDLSQTSNGSISDIPNPFKQGHYIILNQAIGGINGGDPSNTTFPVRYEIDYIRVYQTGNCDLDCAWQEQGTAFVDPCLSCVGGNTGKEPCTLECHGNMLDNPGFETGDLSGWNGWGTRSISGTAFTGTSSVQVGTGAIEKEVTVSPYSKYTIRCKGRKSGGGWFRLGVKDYGSVESYTESTATSWTDVTRTFTTGNTTKATVYFYNGSSGTAYGDEFILEPSGCFVTAVDSRTDVDEWQIHPNPSAGGFKVSSSLKGSIAVYNTLGILMLEKELIPAQEETFGADLPNGLYVVHYNHGNNSQTKKWIKR